MANSTVADFVQSTIASLLFSLLLLAPGYVLGLVSNPLGMRTRSAAEKVLMSAMLSVAVTPIMAVLVTRVSSRRAAFVLFVVIGLFAIATLLKHLRSIQESFASIQRSTWVLFGLVVFWFLLVQLSLADVQVGHRLYVSFLAYDHSVRVPLVAAAARSGVPPLNPFFGIGPIPTLRYYYYWYVVCALPMQLGLSAKSCLTASIFWSGVGLASTIPLFLKYVLDEHENLRRKSLIGIALLAVTGLDLIPVLVLGLKFHRWLGDTEWWDTNQVASWIGSFLWVPHHVASLTACMGGLLLCSVIREGSSPKSMVWSTVLAGAAFSSAVGLSIYVALSFGICLVPVVCLAIAERQIKACATYVAALILAVLFSVPFLIDLLRNSGSDAAYGAALSGQVVFLALRDHSLTVPFLVGRGIHSPFLLNLLKIPSMLFVYLLEFGFYGFILVLRLGRAGRRTSPPTRDSRRILWIMLLACLVSMSLLQSNATGTNDLGFRGVLIAQFVLLLWAVPIVEGFLFFSGSVAQENGAMIRPWVKALMFLALAIGLIGTAYQVAMLRGYALLADSGKIKRCETFLGNDDFSEHTYWLRQGFENLNARTDQTQVIQYNPLHRGTLLAHLYSTRQAAMGDEDCLSSFGGDLQTCRQAVPYFAAVFNSPEDVGGIDLDRLCDKFHINVLVATDADAIWQDRAGWVWSRPVVFSNRVFRAVQCGTVPLARLDH